jgi:hypothetical protein
VPAPGRRVLVFAQLERGKEDAGDLLADEGTEHLPGFFGHFADRTGRVAPKQRVRPRKSRTHHPMADGLENLGKPQFRYEEAEGSPLGQVRGEHVGSRAGTAGYQAHPLQIQDSLGHGDAGSAKQLAQLCFAGQPVTAFQGSGLDVAVQVFEDPLVFDR